MKQIFILAVLGLSCMASVGLAYSVAEEASDVHMHPQTLNHAAKLMALGKAYEDADFWRQDAQRELQNKLNGANDWIVGEAKNTIFFLGDGMSVPTVTAARIYKGQKVDHLPYGEEAKLHMDSFPNVGMSKTFCADSQVADSACSATAYLCGVKANIGTIGLTPAALRYDCDAQADPRNQVSSVLSWAQAAGKSTGVVTTTRITHASPTGTYANIGNRDWESDSDVVRYGNGNASICHDIAYQLIMNEPGKNINVILGGGRQKFMPKTVADPEYPAYNGQRDDGVNLIEKWKEMKAGTKFAYVEGKDGLLAVNTTNTDYLFGLFEPSHVSYLDEQEANNDPSLEEMTRVAIEILSKNPNGFFLFVEGGRIDHAHHDNQIQRALWETIEFDKAIGKADDMTDDRDSLILVTADHAHVMSIAGYPQRGNPLEGIGDVGDLDGLPYNTLNYVNGPGYREYVNGFRPDISEDDFSDVKYRPPVAVPLSSETHGGDDVLILSKGPYSHFLTGIQQQSYIPHLVAFASCIGEGALAPECSSK